MKFSVAIDAYIQDMRLDGRIRSPRPAATI